MKEIFDLSFSPANVFPTILLLFVVLYWLVFLFGMLDLSFMDFDVDVDMDVDIDADVAMDHDVSLDHDVDVDHDVGAGKEMGKEIGGKEPGVGIKLLQFFNLGDIPFMIFFSFFALFYWAFSIIGNHYLSEGKPLIIFGILAGGLIAALLLAKLFTQPMRKLFREMSAGDKPINLLGKLCTLELGVEGDRLGQADVYIQGRHLRVTVRSFDGSRITSGTRCLIMEKSSLNGDSVFTVQRFEEEIETIDSPFPTN